MTTMYQKAKETVSKLGSLLGEKAKEAVSDGADQATSGGGVGKAKSAIKNRQQQIDEQVDKAVGMANGGRVGRKPQRG